VKALAKPTGGLIETYEHCMKRIGDHSKRKRTLQHRLVINQYLSEYDLLATNKWLYSLSPFNGANSAIVLGSITKLEFKSFYTQYMVQQKPTFESRKMYDRIKNSSSKCPFCGFGEVCEVDHFLPKSEFPIYSVLTYNLIPACHLCNHGKSASYASSCGEQTLHPYYDHDEINTHQWVHAEIVEKEGGYALRYFVVPPLSFTQDSRDRVEAHFKEFNLAKRFGIQSSNEIGDLINTIKRWYDPGGADAVKEFLVGEASDRLSRHKNSWQTAMYVALADSEWFYSGGYRGNW